MRHSSCRHKSRLKIRVENHANFSCEKYCLNPSREATPEYLEDNAWYSTYFTLFTIKLRRGFDFFRFSRSISFESCDYLPRYNKNINIETPIWNPSTLILTSCRVRFGWQKTNSPVVFKQFSFNFSSHPLLLVITSLNLWAVPRLYSWLSRHLTYKCLIEVSKSKWSSLSLPE